MKAIKDTMTSKWSQNQWNDLTNILPFNDKKINRIWILNSRVQKATETILSIMNTG